MQINKSALNLPACLVIMDGFGLRDNREGNAIALANTPNLDKLFDTCPNTTLEASGELVGLPAGQMGNSEVGHLNIGAGRVVTQELTRINKSCANGSIATNGKIVKAFENCKNNNSTLHLMGLLSDGGVHSSIDHLFAILEAASKCNVKNVDIHAFLDGRDVPPKSAVKYIGELQDKIEELKHKCPETNIEIATICGRYYAMDRDKRWDRVEAAYNTITSAENYISDRDPMQYVTDSYENEITDEFVVPAAFSEDGVKGTDSIIFFNFRPDRAREITSAIALSDFDGFEREKIECVYFVCLTQYDETFPLDVAFPKEFPDNVLADVISNAGLNQYHIAETEKYAHVTFFLNGGIEEPKQNETRKLIASPKVATYDLQPEMSAIDVCDTLVKAIENDESEFYIVNFANCDMVGHTGSLEAAIQAVETVDTCVGKLNEAIANKGGVALITADHGNADIMIAEDGSPHTAHTTSPVPLILANYTNKSWDFADIDNRALSDIAPTLLTLAGLKIPTEMTGRNLVEAC